MASYLSLNDGAQGGGAGDAELQGAAPEGKSAAELHVIP
jgi:hypothetical protein